MLPLIRTFTTQSPIKHRRNETRADIINDNNTRKCSSPNRVKTESRNQALLTTETDRIGERLHALECENQFFRQELQHLQNINSINQQQRDNEKLLTERISEDLQQVAHSFNTKLQNDINLQRDNEKKAALLFAEIVRIGHRVETLDCTLKISVDNIQRKLETQEEAKCLATTYSNQQVTSSTHDAEFHRQLKDMQDAIVQFRTEFDADRRAISKSDAEIDAKLNAQVESLHAKQMTDNRDLVRKLDELTTGLDFQQISSHMREFANVNDNVIALKRWTYNEFGQIKRVFQALISDMDARFQCVLVELAKGVKIRYAAQMRQEEEFKLKMHDLEEAVRDVLTVVQEKVCILEQVVPLEAQARQKYDEKLHRRMESLTNTMNTLKGCREEQASIVQRIQQLDISHHDALDNLTIQYESMRETVQIFKEDVDATLIKLLTAVEHEHIKMMQWVAVRETATLEMLKVQLVVELRRIRNELKTLHARTMLHEEKCSQSKQKTDELQTWSTKHAQECRLLFNFYAAL
ncbi:uncharacterized protein PHALS_04600 [Plasmopara halstedii]|uniref:Uncharacterized protein n=1 Tax=Plasmopara halstedii TaxID=4781 RepID=A0A0P1AAA6_PLAHL|nr:uncharacterized protein PHALS_04600 [Plasmopara halstedii]CEG37150.1 hypothetical protein PHALS_04600 [Plasmopara halstedii]|eukprot:XP_024573519.1 hypothetical protein PHALS_04600 [Plasmopara halstedii]